MVLCSFSCSVFRLHRVQTIAICDPVHLSCGFMQLYCANTAERIEVLLGVEMLGDPMNIIFFPTDSMQPLPNHFGPVCFVWLSVPVKLVVSN